MLHSGKRSLDQDALVLGAINWRYVSVINWKGSAHARCKLLGISNSSIDELNGAMLVIEIASQKGWRQIWLETDSVLVTLAFKSHKLVPWQRLRNTCLNSLHICSSMSFFVTHVFREGTHCADKLADIGFSLQVWGDSIPREICWDFAKKRQGTICFASFLRVRLFTPLLFDVLLFFFYLIYGACLRENTWNA